jgi:protein involved in polysaccharide export with SLBB domain
MVSTGDVISIHVYGDRDKNYNLEVKNDRSVELDFIGPVVVGGMSFKEAKRTLKAELQAHYQMSEFSIKIAKYTTIQVTLVGDVKYPGIYNLSSFSTVKDLLITAKGVRKSASVRDIVIRRNGRTIAHLDFYELLFKGNRFGTKLLKQGDIVIIKKAKKLVSIDGYVKNAAIFELKDGESLYTLINYAGGMKPDASKANIKVDRYSKNSKFETYKLSFAKSKRFAMQDGDKVYVYPLDFTAKQSINVYGNIIRPGSYRLNKSRT